MAKKSDSSSDSLINISLRWCVTACITDSLLLLKGQDAIAKETLYWTNADITSQQGVDGKDIES